MAYRLARLPRNVSIVDANGLPSATFQKWWQSQVQDIELALNSLQDAIDAIAAAQAAADAANAAAATAEAAAASAQGAADAATLEQNLINSYVTGATITATDAGANVSVSVSSHTRVYGDGSTLAISGATLTGLAYSTLYYLYYIDATRADTTPTIQATTSQVTAAQTGDTHLIGSVTTPAAAGAPTGGKYVSPPRTGELQ